MSRSAKTDYLGIATANLLITGNDSGATNGEIKIPGASGAIIANEVLATIKNPSCDYEIKGSIPASGTGALALELGKVHGTNNPGPYALKSVNISTSAGSKPTFSATGVQIESGATSTVKTYACEIGAISAAHEALTFGAFTFTESASLTLQSSTLTIDCTLDPTIVESVPVASDATAAYKQVAATFWTLTDATAPTVTAAEGWSKTVDFKCQGQDSGMYVWTATFTKYLAPVAP